MRGCEWGLRKHCMHQVVVKITQNGWQGRPIHKQFQKHENNDSVLSRARASNKTIVWDNIREKLIIPAL